MIKKAILLFQFIVLITVAPAQEIEWQNTIGGSGYEELRSIKQTTDGGYILGGTSSSNISGDKTENSYGGYDYWIVKTNSIGVIQWENTIGGNDDDQLYVIIQTTDSGFLLGGYSRSNISGDKTENSNGLDDYWIVKTDSLGTIQWQNTIGGSEEDRLYTLRQTTDGGYILSGYSASHISGDKTENSNGFYDYWIVKIDSLGTIEWQNTIGGSDQDFLYSIQQTTDGGYIVGGCSASNISGDKTENSNGGQDFWIVKTDSLGTIEWQNTIGGSADDLLLSLQQTSEGGYILSGYSSSDISGDKSENSNGVGDYWIVKTDSLGTIEWQNTIGGSSNDYLRSIQQTTDEGYILGGYSNSNISGDKTENSIGGYDYWIIKTDSLGTIKWQNTIGGYNPDVLFSLEQTNDGEYILGGGSSSNISDDKTENSQGLTDYWIVKITENYNQIQGKTYADLNSNQVQEPSDPAIPYVKVTESNTSRFAFSQFNGFYSVSVLDTGNFEVFPDYLNFYNPVPLVHTGNFTTFQQSDSLDDFAFQPTGTFNDLCLTITPTSQFRSGFNANYSINYSNYGTTTITPTIVFYPDNNVAFLSASITPSLVTPDSVVFAVNSLSPFQSGQIAITVSVNSGLPIGTLINSGAMILPISNDANPGCNSSFWEVFTKAAIDPNDILVNRNFLYDYEMPTPPDLEYIINFQNTGNDTAFTVKILNPIDTNKLDLSTLEIVATSHPADVKFVYHERNLEFLMYNILLPDSNVNEMMSHGFVRYRIKPKSSVAVGDSIQNFAAIYFDFNNPVITNTAVTHILVPTGLAQTNHNSPPTIYPNPFVGEINIQLINVIDEHATIDLINMYGQKVKVLFDGKIDTDNWSRKFDLSGLSKGVYLLVFHGKVSGAQSVVKL